MSLQHAQQLITEFYDYGEPGYPRDPDRWATPASTYARQLVEWLTGERKTRPRPTRGLHGADCIRERVERELAR
jgi:hypothetical protein